MPNLVLYDALYLPIIYGAVFLFPLLAGVFYGKNPNGLFMVTRAAVFLAIGLFLFGTLVVPSIFMVIADQQTVQRVFVQMFLTLCFFLCVLLITARKGESHTEFLRRLDAFIVYCTSTIMGTVIWMINVNMID